MKRKSIKTPKNNIIYMEKYEKMGNLNRNIKHRKM